MLSVYGVMRALSLRPIDAPVQTVSDVLTELDVTRVDLMKIDVEGAELDVLEGIGASDWQRIKQIVVEVHNVDGRVERIVGMLREQGFNVTIDQEDRPLKKLLQIHMVYARRSA